MDLSLKEKTKDLENGPGDQEHATEDSKARYFHFTFLPFQQWTIVNLWGQSLKKTLFLK